MMIELRSEAEAHSANCRAVQLNCATGDEAGLRLLGTQMNEFQTPIQLETDCSLLSDKHRSSRNYRCLVINDATGLPQLPRFS
jgi:hypothetical protein